MPSLHTIALMKKHSKTGVDSRYQGTIIGKPADIKPVKIEGGPAESIEEWCAKTRERAAKPRSLTHEDVEMAEGEERIGETQDELQDVATDSTTQ